jgi:hypothetical protein
MMPLEPNAASITLIKVERLSLSSLDSGQPDSGLRVGIARLILALRVGG